MDLDLDGNEVCANTAGYHYQLSSWPARDGRTGGNNSDNIDPIFTSASYIPTSTAGKSTWPGIGSVSPFIPYDDFVLSQETWPIPETDSESFEQDLTSPIEEGVIMSFKQEWSPQPSSPSLETNYPIGGVSAEPRMSSGPKPASRSNSICKAKPAHKLRTAARKPRKSSGARSTPSRTTASASDPDELASPEELRARRNHNLVEKQYRNRLNNQFERLLSVLPPEQQRPFSLDMGDRSPPAKKRRPSGSSSSADSVFEDKRMSKAEVLDVATRRIQELEEQRAQLLREKTELLQNMEIVNSAVAEAVVRGRPTG